MHDVLNTGAPVQPREVTEPAEARLLCNAYSHFERFALLSWLMWRALLRRETIAVPVRPGFWNCYLGARTHHLPPWGEVVVFVAAAPTS